MELDPQPPRRDGMISVEPCLRPGHFYVCGTLKTRHVSCSRQHNPAPVHLADENMSLSNFPWCTPQGWGGCALGKQHSKPVPSYTCYPMTTLPSKCLRSALPCLGFRRCQLPLLELGRDAYDSSACVYYLIYF